MKHKFKGKYRIPSVRLQHWDYGWDAIYFVTICTQNREHYFGNVCKGKMELSEIGHITKKYWYSIPEYFPYITLDAFVVMPNHIHGIIIIDKPYDRDGGRDAINRVSTVKTPQTLNSKPGGITGTNNPMLHQNLSRIIRWYKGRVTYESRKIHMDFEWQSRFHDHIIRNNRSLKNIQNYIHNNPENWGNDRFYSWKHGLWRRD